MSKQKIIWQNKINIDLHWIILFSSDETWDINNLHYLSRDVRKPVFGVSD